MIRKNVFLTLLLLSVSCAHEVNHKTPAPNYEGYAGYECLDAKVRGRAPSSAIKCQLLVDTNYVENLRKNPEIMAEKAVSDLSVQMKSPISISDRMNQFRKRFISLIKNTVLREPIVRSFEAALRMKSSLLENQIRENGTYAQYDMVIVGAGVHGVLTLNRALSVNPKLKILIIDDSDTAAATFRYAKEAFNINSSNRASGVDQKPLPGEGNINELPGLPLQISDLTNVKYPTANDLGSAVNIGLYAAVREYPHVDVLFNSSVQKILAESKSIEFPEGIEISTVANAEDRIQIDTQKLILTTGLGTPRYPKGIEESLAINPELSKSKNGQVPRVLTFEDIIRAIGSSNNPSKMFAGKRIAVVGTGVSANVFIEFLLGYATREGYASSVSQDGRPSKILWIGQEKQNCLEFIETIRSRYQQISTGFRSSSDNVAALISPIEPKIESVRSSKNNQVKIELEREKKYYGDEDLTADMIILTTGFNQNLRELLAEVSDGKSTNYNTDLEYFESKNVTTLQGPTSVSQSNTRIGRQINGREIYIVGTAAGKLAADSELVGIVQNFVSIFNNAPRVLSTIDRALQGLKATVMKEEWRELSMSKTVKYTNYEINNIQETRLLPTQSVAYLQSTLNEALSFLAAGGSNRLELEMKLNNQGGLDIISKSTFADEGIVKLLAQTRDFYSVAAMLLRATPDRAILFTAVTAKSNFDLTATRVSIEAPRLNSIAGQNTLTISNPTIRLKGLELVKGISKEKAIGDVLGRELLLAFEMGSTKKIEELIRNPQTNLNLVNANGKPLLLEIYDYAGPSFSLLRAALKNPKLNVNTPLSNSFLPNVLFLALYRARAFDEGYRAAEILMADPRIDLKVLNRSGQSLAALYQSTAKQTNRNERFDRFLKAQGLYW